MKPSVVDVVRAEMARQDMSQAELARRCMVSQGQISRWLSGGDPRLSTVQQVMVVLGLRVVPRSKE